MHSDDRQTVAEYLNTWLEIKQRSLKPTTLARYRDYIVKDLSPALGATRLGELTPTTSPPGSPSSSRPAAGRSPSTAASRPCPVRSATPYASTVSCTIRPASPTSLALDAEIGCAGPPPRR